MNTNRVRTFLRDYWADERSGAPAWLLGTLLATAEAPFRLVAGTRNAWYDLRRPPATPIPVVSVGNLTVGGAGKTPVVRWLADWFRGKGVRAAVVVRGYGKDEVMLYRRWFGRDAVFVGADRLEGVRAAGARGHQLALVDDGFQHRRLPRALDILLVAAEDPPRVRLLPRGPYREPLAAARRATHVLVTRRTARRGAAAAWRERLAQVAPEVPALELEMKMGDWSDLTGAPADPPRGDVLAVCAIAGPDAFAIGLERLLPGADIELASYPDHHDYTPGDVAALLSRRDGRTMVCTAKDATKLSAFGQVARHCTVVGFRVAGEPDEPLRGALARLARNRCASR